MLRRRFFGVLLVCASVLPTAALAQSAQVSPTAPVSRSEVYTAPPDVIAKIRDEGLNKSKVMETLSYLTDVIGPRLTNSPNMKRANEWTRDTMMKWGMQNAKLEPWGPWGRGWSLRGFSAQVVDPQAFPVIAFPKAWSPSTPGPVTGEVIMLDAKTEEDLMKYKGQLRGKIVLMSDVREIKADFDGFGTRRSDEDLAKMAAFDPKAEAARPPGQQGNPSQMEARFKQFQAQARRANFIIDEGPAVIVDNSFTGSGGTVFVSGASVAGKVPETIEEIFTSRRSTPWAVGSEKRMVPQMTMATEDYNRLVRMIKFGVKPKMTVDIQAQYHEDDLMGYNTVAEIPGTDPKLKDEIVMLGAHLDSWHSAGGATDNAAGSAVAMEAARILLAAGLKPRRTIRVALWSGEEQGLNGSREYVKQQFGEMKGGSLFGPPNPNAPKPELIKAANYDKLSVYYNLDNGTGKIRGVYMQGNDAVRPYFQAWLTPFHDLGAKTLTLQNTGGTDHLSFDRIGLSGFQFIQDEIEYSTRTHHSNQDNYDRIQADDMKQAATVMAAFIYQSAMMDEKMPRKALP
jgi:hypothetical protein